MAPRQSNLMRVAGGAARGVRLKGPAASGIRPTTERVRAAIFNILETRVVAGARALDLFAGTGSLGIEALSRGAASADFVERNRRQLGALVENLARAGYSDIGRAHCDDTLRWLARQGRSSDGDGNVPALGFGLALLDPPYGWGDPALALDGLAASGLLTAEAVVVLGHSSRREPPAEVGGLFRYDRRAYGDNGVAFYRWAGR